MPNFIPKFLRYQRVPVWDELSEASSSNHSSPEHVVNVTRNEPEQQSLLPSSSSGNPHDVVEEVHAHPAVAAATATAVVVYEETSQLGSIGPPKVDMSAPPPYSECETVVNIIPSQQIVAEVSDGNVMLQPPSYEEVERIKAVEAQLESGDHILLPPHTGPLPLTVRAEEETSSRQGEEDLLGTDSLFFLSFAAAFLFNWVGFIVMVCFCHSVAGRSGALAGFGLSLAKWVVIVRHTTKPTPEPSSWLLWLIMVLGLVICMRAVLQYVNAKREWQHASAASRHRFLLFH